VNRYPASPALQDHVEDIGAVYPPKGCNDSPGLFPLLPSLTVETNIPANTPLPPVQAICPWSAGFLSLSETPRKR